MIPTVPRSQDPTRAQRPPEHLEADHRRDVLKAINAVKRRYPGPAGRILAAEIEFYLAAGHRVDHASPVPQLIAELLAEAP